MNNCINLAIDFKHYNIYDYILIIVGLTTLGLIFGFRYMYLLKNTKDNLDDKKLKILISYKGAIFASSSVFILFKLPILGILYFSMLLGIIIYLYLGYITTKNDNPPTSDNKKTVPKEDSTEKTTTGQSLKKDNRFGDLYLKKIDNNYIKSKKRNNYINIDISKHVIKIFKKKINLKRKDKLNDDYIISKTRIKLFGKIYIVSVPHVNNYINEHVIKIFKKKINIKRKDNYERKKNDKNILYILTFYEIKFLTLLFAPNRIL